MKGKNKCRILKQIRQKIADENDIPYVTRECTYQGSCRGTCPKCEAELRYLEQQLEKRRSLGQSVAVAAVAATLSLSLIGCIPKSVGGSDGPPGGETVQTGPAGTEAPDPYNVVGLVTADPDHTEPTYEPLEGEPEYIPTGDTETAGEPEVLPTDQTETFVELEGDVAVFPEPGPADTTVPADENDG